MKKQDTQAAFKEAYASLNSAQRQAVDSIEGPVMVIAGPGTGKTQVLTLRIANILLKTDTAPEQILALTFTDAGAQAMRERLRKYIGTEAYRVHISTFHGFSQRLIGEYPDAYPKIIGGHAASEVEKVSIVEEVLSSPDLKILRPTGNPTYYVKPVLGTISDLKRENISPNNFAQLVEQQELELNDIEQFHTKGAHKGKQRGEYTNKEKSINKNKALLLAYRHYEALFSDRGLYDFDDMIMETVKALESNEDMLHDLQERHQYLLADEHQDVNGAQNRILELLADFHESPNVFVVGDEKQAIYRFQGASLENFLAFEKLYQNVTTISLTKNYRSGQTILDAAHELITVEDETLMRLRVPLTAEVVKESVVTNQIFAHQVVEEDWVVAAVQSELKAGTSPGEIAVIVRNNEEVENFSALLRREGVPVRASAESDVLQHPITRFVRSLINAVTNAADTKALFNVLHAGFWDFSAADLTKVLSAQSFERSLFKIISDRAVLEECKVAKPEAIIAVAELIDKARSLQSHKAPHRVVEYLLEKSGYLAHIMQHDPLEGTRVVRRLYDEIEAGVVSGKVSSLQDVSLQFAVHEQYGLALTAPYIVTDAEAVHVLTAHKSKGLEYEVVFMPHTIESRWGGKNRRQNFNIQLNTYLDATDYSALEDERRLMYVAMTRAKRALHLSEAKTNQAGKDLITANLKTEISEDLITVNDTGSFEKSFSPIDSLKTEKMPSIIASEILKEVLATRGFSATSLNNYLSSPWNYLYRNVLQVPETQAEHMQFGTAMHNTLEQMTREHSQSGSLPMMSKVKLLLESQLKKLPLETHTFTTLLEKGLEMLVVYREHLEKTLPKQTKEEMKIRVLLPTGLSELPEIPLTGKLDRIDLDESGTALRVVDYKTGKPKTRNHIEGKTQSSDGGYKRQLVFYALLLELSDDERYRTRDGVLSFVEPTPQGEIKEEQFSITDEEIETLREEIISAALSLLSGEAFTDSCDPAVCDYCDLAALLIKNSD